jgi:energy-converting hydrogenase B subunit D
VIGWLQTGVLLLVAAAGAGVVLTRDPLRQSIAVSFYGLTLALMFFLHQAPDVALSQIVVGAVALPLMIVLALAKVHQQDEDRRDAGDAKEAGSVEQVRK